MSVKESDSLECPRTDDLLEAGQIPLPGRGKPSVSNPLGRPEVDTKGLNEYQRKPIDSKREILRDKWATLAFNTLDRANSFALTVTKKDFGRLMQIATVAGIGYDKVFPKGESVANNLVLNIFNGLPQSKVCNVIGSQPTPKGDCLVENKPLDDNT